MIPRLSYCSSLHLSLPCLFSLHLVLVQITEIILQSCGKNNFPEREHYFSFSHEATCNSYFLHTMPQTCEIHTADLLWVSYPTDLVLLRKTSNRWLNSWNTSHTHRAENVKSLMSHWVKGLMSNTGWILWW